MDSQEFIAGVNAPGAYCAVEWRSPVRPAAAHRGRDLVKISTAVVRTGVAYANLGENADRETGSLPWGEWERFPYVVVHRGSAYGRLYVKDGTIQTRYLVDGQEVTREEFLSLLTPSQRESRRPVGGTITVRLDRLRFR